ncbi:MAG: S9 family peptidase [Mesorhizobium sp.]|uniref:alpha/beta hydrolase family protein n=1 Tax=Mesorhizobium sp. TaxID=1871066 RepID=UPI001AC1DB3B|nr:prolyl oligopeptidase family serine peptidase [Mesorhizobium sp.]MBN9217492.1 S9 family peptidase [Mesorhizobium sp.]
MQRDFRSSTEFEAAHRFYSALLGAPGHVFGGRSLCGHQRDGQRYFIGQSFEGPIEAGPSSRLYQVERGGALERLSEREARQIRLSPEGKLLAFACQGDSPAMDLIEIRSHGAVVASTTLSGRIEQIDWSPDGGKLLVVVAGTAADLAGIHGGYAQKQSPEAAAWLPQVQLGEGDDLWRRIWVWDLEGAARPLTAPPLNVWEASWCGHDRIAALVSDDHGEGSWYRARLALVDAASGAARTIHTPNDQIGCIRGSPGEAEVAFIQAFCSDRGLVAGLLSILDLKTGKVAIAETLGVDVTSVEWRSATTIHFAGARGPETVSGDFAVGEATATQHWASRELTHGEWVPASHPIGEKGALFIAESWSRAPFLAEETGGEIIELASLAAPDAAKAMARCGAVEVFEWTAPAGLDIQGWLVRPAAANAPTPLLVDVHGGPVSAHRNRWLGRSRAGAILASRGWTVLFPNPRGSTGRGDGFARAVKGDMGGADAQDIISGVDALIRQGLVDAARVAVTGTSYGGFMSAWLPSQTDRFAVAVPISPVGDWYSQHRTSQIPEFDEIMLTTSPWQSGGDYFSRSPAFHKHKKAVPSLIMAGGIDKSTPPGQAEECHFAALRSGAPSALLVYPNAGHSLRGYPEYIDTAARILWWLEKYIAKAGESGPSQKKEEQQR